MGQGGAGRVPAPSAVFRFPAAPPTPGDKDEFRECVSSIVVLAPQIGRHDTSACICTQIGAVALAAARPSGRPLGNCASETRGGGRHLHWSATSCRQDSRQAGLPRAGSKNGCAALPLAAVGPGGPLPLRPQWWRGRVARNRDRLGRVAQRRRVVGIRLLRRLDRRDRRVGQADPPRRPCRSSPLPRARVAAVRTFSSSPAGYGWNAQRRGGLRPATARTRPHRGSGPARPGDRPAYVPSIRRWWRRLNVVVRHRCVAPAPLPELGLPPPVRRGAGAAGGPHLDPDRGRDRGRPGGSVLRNCSRICQRRCRRRGRRSASSRRPIWRRVPACARDGRRTTPARGRRRGGD